MHSFLKVISQQIVASFAFSHSQIYHKRFKAALVIHFSNLSLQMKIHSSNLSPQMKAHVAPSFPLFLSHTPKSLGPHPLSLSHSSPSPPPPSYEINSPPLLLEIGKTRPFLPKRHLPLPSLAEEPRRLRRLLLPHALRGWKAVSVNRSGEHSIPFDSRTLGVINAFPPKR